MHNVEPEVFLIAETQLSQSDLQAYLDTIGADQYEVTAPSGVEALTEVGGKLCYRAWQPELNPNVTKVRTDNKAYIDNINKVAHGSVEEHASVSFIFHNVSRVFTHELIRHRAGVAISQESLRYVRLTELGFWVPKMLKDRDNENGDGVKLVEETVKYLEEVQAKLAEIYGITNIKNFGLKKKLTSAFRRVAPIGLGTGLLWSANINALRHVIQQRTSRHAEEEIRLVFGKVAGILTRRYPHMFGDFYCELVDDYPEWKSKYAKMPYDADKVDKLTKILDQLTGMGWDGESSPEEFIAALKDVC